MLLRTRKSIGKRRRRKGAAFLNKMKRARACRSTLQAWLGWVATDRVHGPHTSRQSARLATTSKFLTFGEALAVAQSPTLASQPERVGGVVQGRPAALDRLSTKTQCLGGLCQQRRPRVCMRCALPASADHTWPRARRKRPCAVVFVVFWRDCTSVSPSHLLCEFKETPGASSGGNTKSRIVSQKRA